MQDVDHTNRALALIAPALQIACCRILEKPLKKAPPHTVKTLAKR